MWGPGSFPDEYAAPSRVPEGAIDLLDSERNPTTYSDPAEREREAPSQKTTAPAPKDSAVKALLPEETRPLQLPELNLSLPSSEPNRSPGEAGDREKEVPYSGSRESAARAAKAPLPDGAPRPLLPELNLTLPSAEVDRDPEPTAGAGAVTWDEFTDAFDSAGARIENPTGVSEKTAPVFPPSYYLQPSYSSPVPISRILSFRVPPPESNEDNPGKKERARSGQQDARRHRREVREDGRGSGETTSSDESELSNKERHRKIIEKLTESRERMRRIQEQYRIEDKPDKPEDPGWIIRYPLHREQSDRER